MCLIKTGKVFFVCPFLPFQYAHSQEPLSATTFFPYRLTNCSYTWRVLTFIHSFWRPLTLVAVWFIHSASCRLARCAQILWLVSGGRYSCVFSPELFSQPYVRTVPVMYVRHEPGKIGCLECIVGVLSWCWMYYFCLLYTSPSPRD